MDIEVARGHVVGLGAPRRHSGSPQSAVDPDEISSIILASIFTALVLLTRTMMSPKSTTHQVGALILMLCISAEAFVRLEPRAWLVRSLCMTSSSSEEESSPFVERDISSSASKDSSEFQPSPPIVEYDDFLPQPNSEWGALQVVEACMDVMLERKDAGLEVCFNFSSDRCRAALGGSLEKFAQYATNPVFGYLVNCQDYQIVSVGPVIEGTPTRGAMQTILMDALQQHAKDDSGDEEAKPVDARRFLWTLQKERRPPRQGFWIIHEVIYVKNALDLTI